VAALAAKREELNAFQTSADQFEATKVTPESLQALEAAMNDSCKCVGEAARVVMATYLEPLTEALLPFCLSRANALGIAGTTPAAGQLGNRLIAPRVPALQGTGQAKQRLALIELLLSGEIEFEYKPQS